MKLNGKGVIYIRNGGNFLKIASFWIILFAPAPHFGTWRKKKDLGGGRENDRNAQYIPLPGFYF